MCVSGAAVNPELLTTSQSAHLLMREQKPDVSRLDLRVGRVLTVRNHPDSTSLVIQEVELGEPAPRTVVSVQSSHMTPEQVQEINSTLNMFDFKPAFKNSMNILRH